MDNGKIRDFDHVTIKLRKCLGEKYISWLTKFFNEITRFRKMLVEWRKSITSYLLK